MSANVHKGEVTLSAVKEAVLGVVCYFDVFGHPLTVKEIGKNLPFSASVELLNNAVSELKEDGVLDCSGDYYYLHSQNKTVVRDRIEKEEQARKALGKAYFFSRIIGAFPFVEGVCISGSLSKGVLEKDGDVDFFIITSPRRLWLCRSMLILFKKTVLFNSRKYFCTNYFIDRDNLFIPDHNVFTATEISTLLPVVNYDTYREFISANSWTRDFRPNTCADKGTACRPYNRNGVKRLIEFICGGRFGERADNLFFGITLRRWKRKFPQFNLEDFDLNLRSRKTVSKHHPRGYQQKVLNAYAEKFRDLSHLLQQKNDIAASA